MMLVAKLRTIGTAALAALALVTGLGTGLVPARADDAKPSQAPGANAPAVPKPPAPADDATFFRRVCLDLRGTPPTPVESGYFAADRDVNKRRKVVDWLLTDDAVKAFLAKKLGVPAERVRSITLNEAITVVLDASASVDRVRSLAFSPDGKTIAVEFAPLASDGIIMLNERNFDVLRRPLAIKLKHDIARIYPVEDLVVPVEEKVAGEIAVLLADELQPDATLKFRLENVGTVGESDAEFLRKAVQSARGTAPSAVEEKYFAEDKDPKKREKLLDLLLKDPAVAKKFGDDWKQKMLQPQAMKAEVQREIIALKARRLSLLAMAAAQNRPSGRLDKLVNELLWAQKSDEQILDGVSLVVLGRLPTESEKRLTLAAVSKAGDKKAAWVEVAKALSATEEAKKHAAELAPAKPPEKK